MFERIKDLISKELNIDKSTITLESRLIEDLGADSLDAVELILALEDEYGISISDEEAMNFKTVKDIVDFAEKQEK